MIRLDLGPEPADLATARAALWAELVTTYVEAPSASFRAAAWWALEALWPEPDRRAHGLFAPARPQVRWP